MSEMDKCREEFEKQKYWIGLFREAVDFDEELGRYVLNGQRKLYAFHLDSFNEKWEVWQKAWQHQQAKVEELQTNTELLNEAFSRSVAREEELQKRVDILSKRLSEVVGLIVEDLEQALKGEV